jgi:hypothetical protein
MFTRSDEEAVRLWFEAFDPAVTVEVTPNEVIVRSTRRRRDAVRCTRPKDLHRDLDGALSRLVEQIS